MNAPEIRIIGTDFTYYGVVSAYKSLIWNRKLYEIGDIELHLHWNDQGAKLLEPGRILFLDEQRAGMIVSTEVTESKNGREMTVNAKELKGIVSDRIVLPGVREEGKFFGYDRFPDVDEPDAYAESVIKHYVSNHMITPEDPNRAYPKLTLGPDQNRGVKMRWQARYDGLDTVLKEIGEWSGMGYEIRLDLDNEEFLFEVIPGENRADGKDATPVIFSTEFYNLENCKYAVNWKNWRNTGYAGGAGEDEDRLIYTVYENEAASGFERKEVWLDCGSISDIEDLTYEAKYKLEEKTKDITLNGTVVNAGLFQYRENWDLGDLVVLRDRVLGVKKVERITGIRESYEQGKFDLDVTFGKRQKNIVDEVRKVEAIR